MPGATVRISETSRELLRELAHRTRATMQDVIELALAEYRKRLFWEQAARDFQSLRDEPRTFCPGFRSRGNESQRNGILGR